MQQTSFIKVITYTIPHQHLSNPTHIYSYIYEYTNKIYVLSFTLIITITITITINITINNIITITITNSNYFPSVLKRLASESADTPYR